MKVKFLRENDTRACEYTGIRGIHVTAEKVYLRGINCVEFLAAVRVNGSQWLASGFSSHGDRALDYYDSIVTEE